MDIPYFDDVSACLQALRAGGVILYPTDTIWGLGCDPRNADAVRRLFSLKQRPPEKSVLLLAAGMEQVEMVAGEIPAGTEAQISGSDRPLTIIYPNADGLAHGVCAEDGSVGIRIPDDPFCKALTEAYGFPITSTSANLSNQPFDGSFSDVPSAIVEGADHVVVWRRAAKVDRRPSRIVKWMGAGEWLVIRE